MNNDEETFRFRVNNRLKVFQNVFFMKKVDYSEYLQYMQEFFPNETSVNIN